jgi:hypothetical protein
MNMKKFYALLCGAAVITGGDVFGGGWVLDFSNIAPLEITSGNMELDSEIDAVKGTITLVAPGGLVATAGQEGDWASKDGAVVFNDFEIDVLTEPVRKDEYVDGTTPKEFITTLQTVLSPVVLDHALEVGGLPFVSKCLPVPEDKFVPSDTVLDKDELVRAQTVFFLDSGAAVSSSDNLLDQPSHVSVRNKIVVRIEADTLSVTGGDVASHFCSGSKETGAPLNVFTKDLDVSFSGNNSLYYGIAQITKDGTGVSSGTINFDGPDSFFGGHVNCQSSLELTSDVVLEDRVFQFGGTSMTGTGKIVAGKGGTLKFSRKPFVAPTPST